MWPAEKRMSPQAQATGALLSLLLILIPTPSHALGTDVVGDNARAAYIGTGGLLLPLSFSGSKATKTNVANCLGCTWRYTIFCMQGANTPCGHAALSCPRGSLLYRVGFGRTPTSVVVIGSVCWGSSQPLTRRLAESKVADYVVRYVPELRPGYAPSGGTLTSIPVIFWTGQPKTFRPPSFSLVGHVVTITATPTWRWAWGDGGAVWKSVPGAKFPSRQVTHQYRTPGTYDAAVTCVWTAKYSVTGVGTFEVSGDVIRQTKELQIPVKSARTVLVTH